MARGCIINCHLDINDADNASRKIVNRKQLQYRSNATSHSHARVRSRIDHPTLLPRTQ